MRRGAVLITGASTGIGEATALHLDELGFRIFAGVRRDEDADKLSSASSDRLRPVILDVTRQDQIDAASQLIKHDVAGEGLAGVVNNAGIPVAGPLEFIPLDELRRVLEVNVVGTIAVTQAVMPMLRDGRGRVVNIGSIGGRVSTPFMGPYSASKFAMEALSDSLRAELRPWGIEVALIEPGNVATKIWQRGIAWGKELRRNLPAEAESLYGEQIQMIMEAAEFQDRTGIAPIHVARAVEHALTSRRPKTRYVVGLDARAQKMVALLPDRLRDRLLGRAIVTFAKKGRGT